MLGSYHPQRAFPAAPCPKFVTIVKAAVFYYTQSGQALRVAQSICSTIDNPIYKEIVPLRPFPFPWSKNEFFDVFPETRLGMPQTGITPIDYSDIQDADIVIVVGQSWFLSPSMPIQAFFCDEQVRAYLKGRNIVFVNACRNMWLMTARKVKTYVKDAGASLVGHIVLQDETPNLVSVLTVIRWLMYGKKERTAWLPPAGVSERDIADASRFGEIISRNVKDDAQTGDTLQRQLLIAGAINYKPSVLFLEKAGHRMFGLWGQFIRKKGGFGDPRRLRRINLFYIYLLTALFMVSPFAQLIYLITYPLHNVPRHRREDCEL